jgi:hypothetical protein
MHHTQEWLGDDHQLFQQPRPAVHAVPELQVRVGHQDELSLMVVFRSELALFDRVIIDSEPSIKATVIGFAFYGHQADVQISYVHSGDIKTAWIVEKRLTRVD